MTGAEAQEALRRASEQLKEIRHRLQEVAAGLPVPEDEDPMLLGEEEPDIATEVRSIVECSLADQIGPAIEDLAAAAAYRPQERRES